MRASMEGPLLSHMERYLRVYPEDLSFAFHHQTVQGAFPRVMDEPTIRLALNKVVKRHAALRTIIVPEGDGWKQVVREDLTPEYATVELSGNVSFEEELYRMAVDVDKRPMDPLGPPLQAWFAHRLDRQGMIVKTHRNICDGASIMMFWNDFAGFYAANSGCRFRFDDYDEFALIHAAAEEVEFLRSRPAKDLLAGWASHLKGKDLSSDALQQRAHCTFRDVSCEMERGEVPAVHGGERLHPALVFLHCFSQAIGSFLDDPDPLVSVFSHNRAGLTAASVGNFADLLIVRPRGPAGSLDIEIGALREEIRRSRSQRLPYWWIVKNLAPGCYRKRTGITPYQYNFIPDVQDVAPSLYRTKLDEGGPTSLPLPYQWAWYDCNLRVIPLGQKFKVCLAYHADAISRESAGRMLDEIVRRAGVVQC